MLPNRSLVSVFAFRHLRLWALVRIALSGLFFLAGTDPLRITPIALCAVVALCSSVSVVEMRVRHEFDLLGNLGAQVPVLVMLAVVPPFVGELMVSGLGAFLE